MTDLEARAWIDAARDPEVSASLEAIYCMIADQVEARGPACWASGRCCNFKKTGHLLYVTGLEAAWTVSRSRSPSVDEIAEAHALGGCPFQDRNLCGVHPHRPLGCRVYFCDRSAQRWQHALTERTLDALRRLHERRSLPYAYGEWRSLLERISAVWAS
ncbi:MAG: YkgJ family cysteine cluster protein [Planctomycetota bacterium]